MISKDCKQELIDKIKHRLLVTNNLQNLKIIIVPIKETFILPTLPRYRMLIGGETEHIIDEDWILESLYDYGKWELSYSNQELDLNTGLNRFDLKCDALEKDLKDSYMFNWREEIV